MNYYSMRAEMHDLLFKISTASVGIFSLNPLSNVIILFTGNTPEIDGKEISNDCKM